MDTYYLGTFSVGQTLDRGMKLFRETFKPLVLLSLIPSLFMVLSTITQFHYQSLAVQLGTAETSMISMALQMVLTAAAMIFYISLIRGLNTRCEGTPISFGSTLKMLKLKDLLLIIGFIVFVIAAAIHTIALVVPLFYFLNIASIAYIVAVVEEKRIAGWLGRTYSLTKGRWWKTLAVNAVSMLIMLTPTMLVYFFALYSIQMEAMQSGSFELNAAAYAGFILYMLVTAVMTPLYYAILVVHYNSLKSEKDNSDLEKELDALTA